MLWFIFAIILFIATAILFVAAQAYKGSRDYPNSTTGCRIAGAVVGVLAIVCLFGSLMRSVPARSIGVPTTFGSVGATMGPGLHFPVNPFSSVNIVPETIQTDVFKQGGGTGTEKSENSCITVRIGGQQQACLDATIQWRILDTGAPSLFKDFNGTTATLDLTDQSGFIGTIASNVVVREFEQVVNNVLGDYNPIEDVSATVTGKSNSEFSKFDPIIEQQMQQDLKGRVQIISLFTPFLHYDPTTQARINSVATQFADTAIAEQEIQTNTEQALANSKIGSSLSSQQLQYQCLTITESALKEGDTLPVGWNCFGGSSTGVAVTPGK